MVSNGKEVLGECCDRDHLTYEWIEALDLAVVTDNGETVSPEELRGKSFSVVERDEPSGYVVRNNHGGGDDTLLPSSVLFIGAVGAGDGDRMGSRSAQVTGLLPALLQARGREVPARQWQDPEDRSRSTNRLLLPCMPAESEVTRKWPGKRSESARQLFILLRFAGKT